MIIFFSLTQKANPPHPFQQNGDTALIRAAEYGHLAVVQALLEAGADINIQNKVTCDALSRMT